MLAPAADAESIDTPLLMQLPESEARYVIEFHTRLKRAGKPAEMILFADEPHIKTQPVHKRAVYERNLDWYRFWLKDEEDPDPAKREQYLRWRQLGAGESLPVPAP
jgi:dipeptidyl aminopeptidase/acylaminoacyl peptidase